MTKEQASLLEQAKQLCDNEDRSTEYMIEYMSDFANVSHDTVVEYLKPIPDALAFIKGCNTGTSKYSLKGIELSNFDKNKMMNMFKLMPQKEFDRVFTAIQDLQHHRDTTVGLWAVNLEPEELSDVLDAALDIDATLAELMFRIK